MIAISERKDMKMKIKIIKNGPYLVTGAVPLVEKIIKPVGRHYEYKDGRKLPQKKKYSLCRCGNSKNHPFCDGSHSEIDFEGKEVAERSDYEKRAELIEGEEIDLRDDHRCALARFCHTELGSTWELTKKSGKKENRKEAIKSANECPSGRLTAVNKEGEEIEDGYASQIEILQDPEKEVSSAIYVKGDIEIEAADGKIYENRNRTALCRCGKSSNKPFCDGSHVHSGFKDKKE